MQDPLLFGIIFKVIQLAMKHGIVLKRWRKVHQMLLLKDPPRTKIHRFRNITLVEADLIFIMKIVWGKHLARNVSKDDSLNHSQYARRGQIAQNNVLNKKLTYNLQHVLRMEAFQSDNDALSCYDRIIDNLAVIATMRLGLSNHAATFLKKQLHRFKHHILLGGQPSVKFFCNSLKQRLHGTGQGTGWSPIIWLAICDVIITVLDDNYPGQLFVNPKKTIRAKQTLDGFVDDSNLSVNEAGLEEYNKQHNTELGLQEASTMTFQGYERLLFLSGGKLALPKCKFYWITFERRRNRYIFSTKAPKKFKISEGFTSNKIELTQYKVNEPHKILGIWVTPTANEQKQVEYMKEKVEAWSTKVANSTLTAKAIRMSFNLQLWPSLTYPIGVVQLTIAQCNKIVSHFFGGVVMESK